MNDMLDPSKMAEATRLTRAGRLTQATALLARMFRAAPPMKVRREGMCRAWCDDDSELGGSGQSLLSMWFHDELVSLVGQYGLADLFTRIDGLRVDIGGHGKTDHLIEHLTALRVDPADVLLIGDVLDDAIAADAAGVRCVLVTTGVMARPALETSGAPVVDSIAEALTGYA